MPSLPRALRVLALLAALPLAPLLPSAGAAPLNQPDQPSRRYLVELTEAPLATYDGRLPGLPATAPNAVAREALRRRLAAARGIAPAAVAEAELPLNFGAARLEVDAPAARAYAAHLRRQQDQLFDRVLRLAPQAKRLMRYHVAFNGMTLRLTPYQAGLVSRLGGVRRVTEEEAAQLFMDTAAERLELPAAWQDPRIGGRPARASAWPSSTPAWPAITRCSPTAVSRRRRASPRPRAAWATR